MDIIAADRAVHSTAAETDRGADVLMVVKAAVLAEPRLVRVIRTANATDRMAALTAVMARAAVIIVAETVRVALTAETDRTVDLTEVLEWAVREALEVLVQEWALVPPQFLL